MGSVASIKRKGIRSKLPTTVGGQTAILRRKVRRGMTTSNDARAPLNQANRPKRGDARPTLMHMRASGRPRAPDAGHGLLPAHMPCASVRLQCAPPKHRRKSSTTKHSQPAASGIRSVDDEAQRQASKHTSIGASCRGHLGEDERELHRACPRQHGAYIPIP